MRIISATLLSFFVYSAVAEEVSLFNKVNGRALEKKVPYSRGLMMGKGKGKGMMGMMGKGSSDSSKGMMGMMGKGSSDYKGKGYDYKGSSSKGMMGKGSSDYKGKGYDYKGSSSKGMMGKGSSDYKGKGYDYKGSKGKGKGYDSKGKGYYYPTILDIIEDTKELSTLESALEASTISEELDDMDLGVTILAPVDDAFMALEKLDPMLMEALQTKDWIEHLQWLLLFHSFEAVVFSGDLKDGMSYETTTGESLIASVGKDYVCFTTEYSEDNTGCVLYADLEAKNGVVHIIDSVLIPYWYYVTITDLAVINAEDLEITTLVELVVCADLADALATSFGITVFAPVDMAFKEFDTDALCKDTDTLTAVLLYHVVPAVVASENIPKGTTMADTLLDGYKVTITNDGKSIMVDDATVIYADALAYNGIVHLIDGVLLPEDEPSKGKGSSSSKGKGKGKGYDYKGKGKGYDYKGKGKGYDYKGSSSKGMMMSGKGSSDYKGKGYDYKGSSSKGMMMSGKGSSDYKGKGYDYKGSSSKGMMGMMGKGSSDYKGKGYDYKGSSSKGMMGMMGKGKGMMGSSKGGKGSSSKGKGSSSKGKGSS